MAAKKEGVSQKKRIVIINNYSNDKYLRHLEGAIDSIKKKKNKDIDYDVVKYDNTAENFETIKNELKPTDIIVSSGGNRGAKIKTKDGVKYNDKLHQHIKDNLTDNYVLGICHGAQALGEAYGGQLKNAGKSHTKRRYFEKEKIKSDQDLFESEAKSGYHANHRYYLDSKKAGSLEPIVESESEHTGDKFIDAYKSGKHYGVQFHPERTKRGKDFLKNFLYMAAGYSK